jgi:succinate-acetate transporter protein
MIRRHFGKQTLQQRSQSVSDSLDQSGALGQSHHSEPQRHDSPESDRDRDRRLRAIERATGRVLQPIIPTANCDREQDQGEPNVIQHANVLIMRTNDCQPDLSLHCRSWIRQTGCMNEPRDTTGNPAPLGLLGFGMTTVLLNFHNAGFFELNTMILAMGICYGGIAQIIAGIMEWRKGNTFATTAFISYGLFWLSLVALIVMTKLGWGAASNDKAMAAYLFMWGLFTLVMFIGTLRLHIAGQVVFGSLTILFFLLAYGDFANASPPFKHFTGYEGIFCGFSAIYTGLAQVLNELYGKTLLPLGPVKT